MNPEIYNSLNEGRKRPLP